MVPFSIAGIQTHVGALQSNVPALLHKIELTVERFPWVQMIVLSELAAHGPLTEFAQPLGGETETAFREAAVRHGVWLLPGSIYEIGTDGKIYNSAPVINPAGEVVARCRKLFPFLPYEANVEPGTEFCVFDVPHVGRIGVSICYDIWFPETTRSLTAMGAEVLLHPVLTGTVDREIELTIARATAAQFQCYVFDINGLATGGVGRSAVIDPAGVLLYQAGGSEEIIPVEVDFAMVRRQRECGLRGLGQPLKSFRDSKVPLPIYQAGQKEVSHLATLGTLETPARGSMAGVGVPAPDTPLKPA